MSVEHNSEIQCPRPERVLTPSQVSQLLDESSAASEPTQPSVDGMDINQLLELLGPPLDFPLDNPIEDQELQEFMNRYFPDPAISSLDNHQEQIPDCSQPCETAALGVDAWFSTYDPAYAAPGLDVDMASIANSCLTADGVPTDEFMAQFLADIVAGGEAVKAGKARQLPDHEVDFLRQLGVVQKEDGTYEAIDLAIEEPQC